MFQCVLQKQILQEYSRTHICTHKFTLFRTWLLLDVLHALDCISNVWRKAKQILVCLTGYKTIYHKLCKKVHKEHTVLQLQIGRKYPNNQLNKRYIFRVYFLFFSAWVFTKKVSQFVIRFYFRY